MKNKARIDYRERDKEVKRSLGEDKRAWINGVAQEAEDAASQGGYVTKGQERHEW